MMQRLLHVAGSSWPKLGTEAAGRRTPTTSPTPPPRARAGLAAGSGASRAPPRWESYMYIFDLTVFFGNIYPYLNEWGSEETYLQWKMNAWALWAVSTRLAQHLDLSGAATVEDNWTTRKNFVSALVSGAIIYPGLVLWLDCLCTFFRPHFFILH